jgi:thiamine biosynthesis lipoprotein
MDAPVPNRREFLAGRAAGDVLVHFVEEAADRVGRLADQLDPAPDELAGTNYVTVLQRAAMACQFEIRLNASSESTDSRPTASAVAALDLIEELEEQLSVFRDSSEISQINRVAALSPVEVEPQLFQLLELAGRLYTETMGAFDLTSGPLSRTWGFHRRSGRIPTPEELAAARDKVGWQNVILNSSTGQIAFARQGTEIHLNSIGKGYALDRAAALLCSEGVEDFLFHGGRSSLIARGNRSGQCGWQAGLRHPLFPRLRLALFRLQNEALSTSGSATQYFRHRGKRYGHIIDPRTGWPAEGFHSVTVIAPTAAEADALSTAFFVMGPEATVEYCRTRPHLKVLMVIATSREGEIEVACINLHDDEWQVGNCSA